MTQVLDCDSIALALSLNRHLSPYLKHAVHEVRKQLGVAQQRGGRQQRPRLPGCHQRVEEGRGEIGEPREAALGGAPRLCNDGRNESIVMRPRFGKNGTQKYKLKRCHGASDLSEIIRSGN